MKKLKDFMYDYGTDGMEAVVQAILSKSTVADSYKKTASEMASRLSEALREIVEESKPAQMSVDEAKDLFMNHSW